MDSTLTDTGTAGTQGEDTAVTSSSTAETGEETETETGQLPPEVHVQWIEVAASDYKLELAPEFEAEILSYTALADGPDISVHVDVIVDADVEGVLVNEVPASLNGFRTWRSLDTELISPVTMTIEVLAGLSEVPEYGVEVTVP